MTISCNAMTLLNMLHKPFLSDLPQKAVLDRATGSIESVFFYFSNDFGCNYEVSMGLLMNFKIVRTFLHCLANRFVSAVK